MAADYSSTSDFPAKYTEAESKTREDVIYKTKKIRFLGRKRHIILQNANGPCPLIAICNVLLLRNDTTLYPYSSEVSEKRLLSLLADALTDSNCDFDSKEEECNVNQNQNLSDAIDRLPCLVDGINVNLKFTRIDDFEYTPELSIFDLLKIPLYHGWIVDSQDFETAIAIGCKSYNDLMTGLVALETVNAGECSKTRSFADSLPAYAGHRRMGKGDIEEEIVLLRTLELSEKKMLGFDIYSGSSSGGESVCASPDENQLSEDDTSVTSVDTAAACTGTLGSSICQQSKSEDQISFTVSEDETDRDVGNKINMGEEVHSISSITKSSGALDHDQPSSKELGDETVLDVETENNSKMTSSEAISQEKTNLEATENDCISEIPLKPEAVASAIPDVRSQDDDEGDKCVSDTNELTPREGEVIRSFLNGNASQLTFAGLFSLQQGLEDCELCVFFHNNHFSTMLKYENELYILVTDQGYLTQRDLVWEKLIEVNGDSVFMTGDFKIFKSYRSESRKWNQQYVDSDDYMFNINNSSKEGMEIDPDLKMAMELQEQDLGGVSDSKVSIRRNQMSFSIQEVKAVQKWQMYNHVYKSSSCYFTPSVYFFLLFSQILHM